MNNYIGNSSTGLDVEYASAYSSYNDTVTFSGYPLNLEYIGNVTVQYGNFSNFTSYSKIEACSYATLTNSAFSSTSSEYGIYLEYGETVNLVNDQIIMGVSSDAVAVYAYYLTGWLNLANDYIYAPYGSGLYFYSSTPQFNVASSFFNTSYGVSVYYYNSYDVHGATISGNTFVGPAIEGALYVETYYSYNINFSNNIVQSPSSDWGEYGIYISSFYSTSNISVAGNTIRNNHYPIYIDGENGYNARIQDNYIVNSTEGIYDYVNANSAVTSNTVINVTGTGIYVYTWDPNTNVSNNLVENLPGFGPMSCGIDNELLEGGNNIVSHNTVVNPGSSGYGIILNDSSPALAYSNTVNGGKYGIYVYKNALTSIFGNTVNNADYGIYSHDNENTSYYSNTINNANRSFYSNYDYSTSVFANTFSDSQINSPQLYFLDIENYSAITFYHNNFLNSTTDSTTNNYFCNASGPLFMNDPLPTGGNYWSNYTGTGTNGIGNTPMILGGTVQDLYPLTSMWNNPTVTFIETGLAAGTAWSALLGGSQKSSTGMSIVFSESNGQYMNVEYSISAVPGYTLSVSSGSVYQNGASNTVNIKFTPIAAPPPAQYKMTFAETGLPAGISWAVTLNGSTTTSTTGSIAFSETNGTYSYSIASVDGYHLASVSGTVTVNGNQQTVSVKFIPDTYTLTVFETGLPSGDYWNFTFMGQNYSTNGTTLAMSMTAGNYSYNVSGPAGYSVSPQSANVTVDGSNITLYVHFSSQKNKLAVSSGGTGNILEGLGIGVLIMVIIGTMGSFLVTGKFPWDLIRKK